jgi:ubiquitin carboxyl-terminal hydrolase 2/21
MLPTWRGRDVGGGRDSSSKCSLLECLNKFVGEELLDGENMVTCDHCKTKRKCNKTMTIFRYPRILVIHMKRFRYTNISREKLSTDVAFPIADLDLSPYISQDKLAANAARVLAGNKVGTQAPMHKPVYDLLGVSHHSGSMHGGHYIAHVNTGSGPGSIIGGINSHASSSKGSAKGTASQLDCNRWMCFNDARVSQVNTASIMGPSAYVLFYKLKDDHEHNWAYKR